MGRVSWNGDNLNCLHAALFARSSDSSSPTKLLTLQSVSVLGELCQAGQIHLNQYSPSVVFPMQLP
jgi:hypothetical protein